jgi:hypothetical protein
VQIPVSEPYQALLVPEAALATDQSIKYVYVVGADGKVERQTVELGGQRGDMRIITSGLKAGEHVIVKGLQRVKPGQTVEAELAAAPEPPPTTVRKPVSPRAPKPEPTPAETKPALTPPAETVPPAPMPRRTPQER